MDKNRELKLESSYSGYIQTASMSDSYQIYD